MNIKATIQKLILSAKENVLKITTSENKLTLKVFDGIPEAPNDGKQYGRKSKQWQEIEGGTTDIDDTVTEEGQNAVRGSGVWTWVMGLMDNLQQWIGNNFLGAVSTSDEFTGDGTPSNPLTIAEIGQGKVKGLEETLNGKLELSQFDSIARSIASFSTYVQLPLTAFTRSGATGSARFLIYPRRAILITGETAGSTAWRSTSRFENGYNVGEGYDYINYDKSIVLTHRFNLQHRNSVNSKKWMLYGLPETPTVADPTIKSIGVRIDGASCKGIVHGGASLSVIDLNHTINSLNEVVEVTTILTAGNKVEWYVNGWKKGESAVIPYGVSGMNENNHTLMITNGTDSIENILSVQSINIWVEP